MTTRRFKSGYETQPEVQGFKKFLVAVDGPVRYSDIEQVTGAVSYAFKEKVAGVQPVLAVVTFPSKEHNVEHTLFVFTADSSKCIRTVPDYDHAFGTAARYIREGSPKRKSDGQRLVKGIGADYKVTIEVPAEDAPPAPVPVPKPDSPLAQGDNREVYKPTPKPGSAREGSNVGGDYGIYVSVTTLIRTYGSSRVPVGYCGYLYLNHDGKKWTDSHWDHATDVQHFYNLERVY